MNGKLIWKDDRTQYFEMDDHEIVVVQRVKCSTCGCDHASVVREINVMMGTGGCPRCDETMPDHWM